LIFSYSLAFDAPIRGPCRNIAILFGTERLEWCDYARWKKFDDTFSCFDRISTCDRRTDRRTDWQHLATA